MDLSTISGGIPAPSPSSMLDSSRDRNACSFSTRMRNSRKPIDATVSRMRYVPCAAMSPPFYQQPSRPAHGCYARQSGDDVGPHPLPHHHPDLAPEHVASRLAEELPVFLLVVLELGGERFE